jgi:ATP-binding cassette subfamily C protein CydC
LSAGERQRIIIARAVLKDGPIFILDEPTANLDPITEKELLGTLFEILEKKTTLLVTHRLVGLNQADWILVLDQGQIVEQGTEADLLSQDGYYRQMWSQQNRILTYR